MNRFTIIPFSKSYGRRTVLSHEGMVLDRGMIYAVVGVNGSGKSTFAKILAGVLNPDESVNVINSGNELTHGKLRIGYLPQRPYVFRMSVEKNILLNGKKNEKRMNQLMEELELEPLKKANGKELSGGEATKMALIRLLMKDYDLLILDEPTASMDIHSTIKTEKILREYQQQTKCSIVLITHSLKQARRVAGMVCFLKEGEILEWGKAEELLLEPQQPDFKEFVEFYKL